jgi:predicted phosphodiesterase
VQAYCQNAANSNINIVLISDLNDAYGSTSYSKQVDKALNFIEKHQPDLVLCAGDMVAGQSLKLSESNISKMWQGFNSHVLQRINKAGIPFAFTFGNHDGSGSERFAHERQIARHFWQKNKPPLPYVCESNFPDYYSFSFKGVYFAIIDAAQARFSKEQQIWLRQALSSKQAIKARLRVVMGHLPLFALAKGRNKHGDVLNDADKLLDLLKSLGADYYISGHHHAFYASRNGALKLIGAGALGGGPRQLLGSEFPACKTFTLLTLPPAAKELSITTYYLNPENPEPQKLVSDDLPARIEGFNGFSELYRKN